MRRAIVTPATRKTPTRRVMTSLASLRFRWNSSRKWRTTPSGAASQAQLHHKLGRNHRKTTHPQEGTRRRRRILVAQPNPTSPRTPQSAVVALRSHGHKRAPKPPLNQEDLNPSRRSQPPLHTQETSGWKVSLFSETRSQTMAKQTRGSTEPLKNTGFF